MSTRRSPRRSGVEATASTWLVIASIALGAACTSGPAVGADSVPSAHTAPSPPPTSTVELGRLRIDQPKWKPSGGDWRLRLSWAGPRDAPIDHYEIQRDGVTVADAVRPSAFVDTDVEPGTRYRYEIVGVDPLGELTRSSTAVIRTGEPRLADARLDGAFAVRMVVDRASGTSNPVRGGAIYFSFDPACASGPCSVSWSVRRARTDGTLRRDGAAYAATLRTPLFIRNCFGDVSREALDVRLRVTRAAAIRGAWRATAIDGSIEEVSSYRGCMTATIAWDVRGTLQS